MAPRSAIEEALATSAVAIRCRFISTVRQFQPEFSHLILDKFVRSKANPARLSFVCWPVAFGLSKPKICRGEIVAASLDRGAAWRQSAVATTLVPGPITLAK